MDKSIFTAGIFKNKFLIYSILLGIILQVVIVSVGPIAKVFSVQSLGPKEWLVISRFKSVASPDERNN